MFSGMTVAYLFDIYEKIKAIAIKTMTKKTEFGLAKLMVQPNCLILFGGNSRLSSGL